MTIIAAVRHKNHLILAADGQATSSKDYIENDKCVKIEEHGDFILAGAGSCSSTAIMKRVLNSINRRSSLDLVISAESTGIKEGDEDSEGTFILLKKDIAGLISDVLYVEIGHIISVQNLIKENQDIVAIGCGASLFRASYGTLESRTLKESKLNIMTAMKVTAELSPYCNDIIDMRVYKVA